MGKIRYNYYIHIVRKAKLTNTMLNRKFRSAAQRVNYNLPIQLNMQKPKKRILNLIMVIRNNRNILYFTKYIHIKNGWRI